jgi:hypothetical protein
MSSYRDGAAGDRLRARLTKRNAEARHAPAGQHAPTLDDLMRTAEERGEYLLAKRLEAGAVIDSRGRVDVSATIFKMNRQRLLAKLGVKPASVGDQSAGPRGSPFAPKPIPGVAQHDIPRLDPRHDPQSALDTIRAMVRAHRKS